MNTHSHERLFSLNASSGPASGGLFTELDPLAPCMLVDDLGLQRGDGIFESFGVLSGKVQAEEEHFARLEHSAQIIDLPLDFTTLRAAFKAAVSSALTSEPAFSRPAPAPAKDGWPQVQALAKLYVTRGEERFLRSDLREGSPTALLHIFSIDLSPTPQREGISAITLDRGYKSDIMQTSPWLLQGAKTLSYAINRAAGREAHSRGAQDAIFVSSDGFVLEGPTSNVIAQIDGKFITPDPKLGLLHGTAQIRAFEALESLGYECVYGKISLEQLRGAEAIFLTNSGHQLTPLRELDSSPVPVNAELTANALAKMCAL